MHTTLISTDQLANHLGESDWVIVDCRFNLSDTEKGRRDYQGGHIPGAIYAHLDDDLSGPVRPGETGRHPLPDVDTLAETFSSWGIGSDVQVVAYDARGGAIAARLWWLLRWLGHDTVAVLSGGFPRWVAESRYVSSETPTPKRRRFQPQVRSEMLATAEDVLDHFGDLSYRLVDSRAPERYRGEEEPLDPVAGHIPGAISYHFARNLQEDETFELKPILRGRFQAILDDVPAERTIFYCGSGVTGAHNVLAMAYAGLGMAKIYAASWSHWITDPERPIVGGDG
jgi:thiosulfate/3-mercaptopyruvate sulfurtransferase